MKSRVERYKALHEKMDHSIDEKVETPELSQFANRLNEIDDHFEPMDIQAKAAPKRAKETELEIFDTFENEYLRDFLDEVKAYNVEKGYRDASNTHQNILKELNIIEHENDEVLETLDKEPVPIVTQDETSFWENYLSNLDSEIEAELEELPIVEAPPVIDDVEETYEEEILLVKDEKMTQELIKLTEEIVENETVVNDESVVLEDFHIIQSEETETQEMPVQESLYTKTEVRKFRVVNALVTIALMGALLAGAIAIKYLILN